MKRNEAPTHVTTWMDLENTMLSERSQTQGHILMVLCVEIVQS